MSTNDDKFWLETLKRSAMLRRLPNDCAQHRTRSRRGVVMRSQADGDCHWRELQSKVWAKEVE